MAEMFLRVNKLFNKSWPTDALIFKMSTSQEEISGCYKDNLQNSVKDIPGKDKINLQKFYV